MNQTRLPIVAIVGEPNAGKSTLLNKIAGKMFAVTSEVLGTTRDRQYIDTSWNGVHFTMVDTAGLTYDGSDIFEAVLKEQIDLAINEADLVLLVVDGKAGPEIIDRKTVLRFRKLNKPVVVAVNKMDSAQKTNELLIPFQKLGLKELFPVSSATGRGMGDLLDKITEILKKDYSQTEEADVVTGIPVAIIGKPNVGKSSLFNSIIKQNRVIVSPIAGTTRTAIDTQITIEGQDYTFIDTAGLKRKERQQSQPDLFSAFQTYKAVRRADICILTIDSSEPITKQDQHIAATAIELHKGVIIAASKYDLYREDEKALRDYISHHFPFLWFSPLFMISSKTGQGIDELIASIKPIQDSRQRVIEQEELDRLLQMTLKKNPPKLLRDQKKPKIYGLRQAEHIPPVFELIVNHPAAISEQYRRYLQKTITRLLNFWGTPIGLSLIPKDRA